MGVHRPNVYGDTLQWYYAYSNSPNTTTISTINTPVQLNRTTGLTSGDNKNMVMDANGVITTKVAGHFMMQFSATLSGGTDDEYIIYWRINSDNQTNGKVIFTQNDGLTWSVSGQTMMTLQEGDTIDLYIENNSGTTNIVAEKFNFTNFKIFSTPTTFLQVPQPPPPPDPSFIFSIDTTNSGSASDTFVLPLVNNGVIDMDVDWGDGNTDNITAYDDPEKTHVYSASGTYEIKISGTLRGWTFGWGGDKAKMTDISQWGDFNFTNGSTFTQCSNMTCTATDVPTISATGMSYVFFGCTLFNPSSAGSWDVSSCTSINSFFSFCSAFNQDIDAWDVSNVSDFGGVFYGTIFNYPLSNWDVSSGTSFNQMFFGTPFNQDIDMWDMSSASSLYSMFYNCSSFNQDLNSWDVSNVNSISAVFTNCTLFDGNVSSWDVSGCTNFGNAFQGTAFNQDITGWDVSSGTNFSYMFRDATSFDQDISGWDVANATNMNTMFRNATSFDQDLGGWDISNVANFNAFMQGATLSTTNYDELLIGWGAESVVGSLTINFGSSKYTGGGAVEDARDNLITNDSWTITDGGIA